MYEDTDTTATAHFKSAADRGVKVRIIFDTNGEKSNNTTAYNTLSGYTGSGGGSISVVWANTLFNYTHEKSIVVDAAIPAKAYAGIFTGNLSSQYYATSRDFLFYENDANDVAAIETTFNSDFSNGGGTKATYSPANYVPVTGDHLVWSSTNTSSPATVGNARSAILAVINGATKTLILDEEEMSDSGITTALQNAATRGVSVKLSMTIATGSGTISLLNTMKAAGVQIVEYPSSGNYLYIHAKVIVADYGTSAETVFLGSENCSSNSLNSNRELGLVFTDAMSSTAPSIIQSLNTTLTSDFACAAGTGCKTF